MKKLLSAIFALSLILSICLFAIGCSENDPAPETNTANATPASYVVIDINPSVELTVSEEGIVLTATAVNDDATVLLSQVEITGKTIEEASALLADKSIELGFIAEGNREISITVCGTTVELETEVFHKIKDQFCSHVQEKCHFNLGVQRDMLLSLKTELETLKAENPDNEAIQKLNIAHYRMIVSAMEKDGTLTLEAALKMSTKELVGLIKERAAKHISKELEKLYQKAEQERQAAYDKVYHQIDNTLIKAHSVAISGLRKIEHQLEILEEYDLEVHMTLTLTKEQVEEIAGLLGLNEEETALFVEKCTGLDGTYTEKNIECAINRIYRNLAAAERDAFEEKYERAEEYMEQLEERMVIPAKYIDLVKTYAEQMVALIPDAEITIPENINTYEEFEEFIEELEEYIEDRIETLEKDIMRIIEELGLKKTLEAELKRIEAELEAAEDAYEEEFERCEEEMKHREEEHINDWMNRHHGGKH